jgi:hypothetical protein
MSKAPKPPARLPAPKSLSKRAAATEEHDRLLRAVWANLDALALALYIGNGRKIAAAAEAKAKLHKKQLATALAEAKSWLKASDDDQSRAALLSIADQLSFAQKTGVPTLPTDLYIPEVVRKILEAPISRDPVHGSGPTVGYIDVEVILSLASSISLDDGIPYWLTPREKETAEQRDRRRAHAHLLESHQSGVKAASWNSGRVNHRLWIDVRPELGSMGQLLRELKVIRDFAPFDTDIAVVFRETDKQAVEMLRNEGFIPLDESVLARLQNQ